MSMCLYIRIKLTIRITSLSSIFLLFGLELVHIPRGEVSSDSCICNDFTCLWLWLTEINVFHHWVRSFLQPPTDPVSFTHTQLTPIKVCSTSTSYTGISGCTLPACSLRMSQTSCFNEQTAGKRTCCATFSLTLKCKLCPVLSDHRGIDLIIMLKSWNLFQHFTLNMVTNWCQLTN